MGLDQIKELAAHMRHRRYTGRTSPVYDFQCIARSTLILKNLVKRRRCHSAARGANSCVAVPPGAGEANHRCGLCPERYRNYISPRRPS